uniref:Uncharacterized protein n=1 Tax=Aegilops tauschii subsp. strangulata TaxID=200361 RepID=A0A453N3K1_AEGTS
HTLSSSLSFHPTHTDPATADGERSRGGRPPQLAAILAGAEHQAGVLRVRAERLHLLSWAEAEGRVTRRSPRPPPSARGWRRRRRPAPWRPPPHERRNPPRRLLRLIGRRGICLLRGRQEARVPSYTAAPSAVMSLLAR